jgi:hypothetical protein
MLLDMHMVSARFGLGWRNRGKHHQRSRADGQYRRSEVPAPQAVNSVQELQMESGTRNYSFSSAHDFPKFVKDAC